MSNTLQRLRDQYQRDCLPLSEVMRDYFPHISSERHFLTEVRQGRIALRTVRLHESRKAPLMVYLHDLAELLDQANPDAADQAA